MVAEKIREYLRFSSTCLNLMAEEKVLFPLFIGLSILGALTESVGITLIVPILEPQGAVDSFQGVPVLGRLNAWFQTMDGISRIRMAGMLLLVTVVLRGGLQYTVEVLAAIIPQRLQQTFTLHGYESLIRADIGYVNQSTAGDMLQGVGGWAARVSALLTAFASVVSNFFILLAYIGLMVALSWSLTLAAVAFVAVMSLALKRCFSGPIRRVGVEASDAQTDLNNIVYDTILGMKLIRLTVAEPVMIATFKTALQATVETRRRLALLGSASAPFLSTAAGLFICAILFAGTVTHPDGSTEWVKDTLLFLFLLLRMLGPVSALNSARNQIVYNMHGLEMQEKFLTEVRQTTQTNGTHPLTRLKEGIRFERVSFSYGEGKDNALDGIDLSIDRGRMFAVVGPSGAGKTTLTALITRLYDPGAGRVLIDGVDLRGIDLATWRRRISVVSQDVVLFNRSVTDNIRFGRGEVPFERVREAARLAAAEEFIETLPQGYDTLLGDRGVRLSGGQQQRIAIARAILSDPDLLILDEATSHLDSITERAIQQAVDQLRRDRTLLVIAHRLSTIRKADQIIVMDKGRVVERGRHEELIRARSIYWDMLEHQRLDMVPDEDETGVAGAGTEEGSAS